MSEHLLLGLAGVIVLGVGAQWLAWRLRMPAILLLLVFGFAAGPLPLLLGLEQRFIDPNELLNGLLLPFVSLAVALILFEGGLSLKLSELREAGVMVRNLVTIGAAITWALTAGAAYWILDLDLRLSVLLGAVLVVTGPTVIGPLLRHVRPRGPVGPILKWEGIVIDPIGALLALLVFEAIQVRQMGDATTLAMIAIIKTLVAGGGLGLLAGALTAQALRRHWVPDFLQTGVVLMLVIATFAASNHIQEESGLLAVTLMGVWLANQKQVDVSHIVEFKENLGTLLIATLFILLSARIDPSSFRAIGPSSIGFVLVLLLVARPLGVLVSSIGTNLSWRERLFIAWLAPRGIVAAAIASVFSIKLQAHGGFEDAGVLVPLTFTVIIATVAIYGLSAVPLARRLGLAEPNPQGILFAGAHDWARKIAGTIQEKGFRVLVVDSNRDHAAAARLDGLPTYHGNVLYEHVIEELDLGGIGRLIALTPNDGVNALAAQHFIHEFGSANVYQLARGGKQKDALPMQLRGRRLFREGLNFTALSALFAAGGVVKATPLTEQFDFDAFMSRYGETALPMFAISADKLEVICDDQSSAPNPGVTLISVVLPELAAPANKEAEQSAHSPEQA